jgi:hypothetical protein
LVITVPHKLRFFAGSFQTDHAVQSLEQLDDPMLGSDKFAERLSLVFHQVLRAAVEIRERGLARVDP